MSVTGTARQYASVVGIVLLLLGVVGFFVANYFLGILNVDTLENIVHLATGAAMAYVGLGQRSNSLARSVVGVLGVIYLLVGILGFVDPKLFGLIPHGYTVYDNIVHLLLGILGIVVGYLLPRDTVEVTTTNTTTTTRP